MADELRSSVEAVHAHPAAGVFAVAGGGQSAVAELLAVPGASRTVIEAVVPYSIDGLTRWLAWRPASACSEATAGRMADRAWQIASARTSSAFGLAATASLATDRPHRGDHRFHLAYRDGDRRLGVSLVMAKGVRTRAEEERLTASALLTLLAEGLSLSNRVDCRLYGGERFDRWGSPLGDPLAAFRRGDVPQVCQRPDGSLTADVGQPAALLSGSFNPLHVAHRGLADAAGRHLGRPVEFELSVANADKGELAAGEVRSRLRQFLWLAPVRLTRAATFPEKARLFPGATFVMGVDTAARLTAERYYGGSAGRDAAMAEMLALGCRVLVAGRADGGEFVDADRFIIPESSRGLFETLPESAFRIDLSSTQLRRAAAG